MCYVFPVGSADLCFSATEMSCDETPPSHSIIDETGIQTLQDLSVLWVSNTEIFTLICLGIFLLAKPSFIPFPSGYKEYFTWNLLPSFNMCFVSFLYNLPTSRVRAITTLWQMLKEIQEVNIIFPIPEAKYSKITRFKRLICACHKQSNLNQSYPS